MTPAWRCSATARSASWAPERLTPPPAMITGSLAATRSATARSSSGAGAAGRSTGGRVQERHLALVLEGLGGDVDDDRARPPGTELARRLADRGGDLLDLEDPRPPLRHRRDGVELVVHLVEQAHVLADPALGNLSRDHEDGRRCRIRGGEARRGVEEARPRHDQGDAEVAARPRVAVGHVRRGLLVTRGDEPDARLLAERGHGAVELDAREPEDHAHALAMERGHQGLPAGHPRHRAASSPRSADHAVTASRTGACRARPAPSSAGTSPRPRRPNGSGRGRRGTRARGRGLPCTRRGASSAGSARTSRSSAPGSARRGARSPAPGRRAGPPAGAPRSPRRTPRAARARPGRS